MAQASLTDLDATFVDDAQVRVAMTTTDVDVTAMRRGAEAVHVAVADVDVSGADALQLTTIAQQLLSTNILSISDVLNVQH